MPSSVASLSKAEWRTRFRSYRHTLSPAAYRAKSALICARATALPEVAQATTVHVYWPQPDQCEIDTRPLIGTLRGRDVTVVLPIVTSYDPDAPTMEHRRYEGPSTLAPNRWGIPEPTDTARIPPEALDVVIVPALGVDHSGQRIGYGSGYYDVFLQDVNAPRILLAYDECFVPSLPTEPHDVPVTTVVTERGTTHIPDS